MAENPNGWGSLKAKNLEGSERAERADLMCDKRMQALNLTGLISSLEADL